jgi:hypothetical protein
VRLVGTEFRAVEGGRELRGADFAGAEFTSQMSDGTTATLRIDQIERSSRPGEQDLLLYLVSVQTPTGRSPMCGTDPEGKPVRALPLLGTFDYRGGVEGGGRMLPDSGAFTFACEGYVLAKCIHLGYRPWATKKVCQGQDCREVDLAPYYQTCTRMMRADYCGDGHGFTLDGMKINIYDAIGIQEDTETWPVEAEWTPAGARCIQRLRVPANGVPPCADRLRSADCGDPRHFQDGTLIMNEDWPEGLSRSLEEIAPTGAK